MKIVFTFLCTLFLLSKSYGLDLESILSAQKVSLLIASPKGFGPSTFGHAYLRFSKQELAADDIVVEIVANEFDSQSAGLEASLRGMGLSSQTNYKSKVVAELFSAVKYEMTVLKDRNLKTLPLILTEEQIKNIIRFLIENKETIEQKDYLFFSNNCASQVSEVLDAGISFEGSRFQSKIPTALEKKYKNIIDQKNIQIDLSATDMRRSILSKHLPKELIQHSHPLLLNLPEQLLHPSFLIRIYGLLKILNLKSIVPDIDSKIVKAARVYALLTSVTEEATKAAEIQKILMNSHIKFQFVPLFKTYLDYPVKLNSVNIEQVTRYEIIFNQKGQLQVRFYYTYVDTSRTDKKAEGSIDIPAENFGLSTRQGQLFYSAADSEPQLLGSVYKTRIFKIDSLLKNSEFFAEVVKGKQWDSILPMLVIEIDSTTPATSILMTKQLFSPWDAIPMKNFSTGIGNCAGLVAVQRILFEQAFFLPEEPQLSGEENLDLLKSAIEGKFIFVPGYKNIREWFSSLNQAAAQKIVSNLNYQINISGYLSSVKKYFTREEVNADNIQDLKTSLALGYVIPIRFVVDTMKQQHAFILTEILDRGSYYELGVYDPNLGGLLPAGLEQIPEKARFKIDKKSGLFSQETYSKGTALYVDPEFITQHAVFIRAKANPRMKKAAEEAVQKMRYALTVSELLMNGF